MELVAEIDSLKGTLVKQKQESKKLTAELSEKEQSFQGVEK